MIALAIVGHALARVGETEEQIAARYGPPPPQPADQRDELGNPRRVYKLHDFIVVISFEDGRSVSESFLKQEGAATGKDFQQPEIDAILGANLRSGVTWKPTIEGIAWETSDGKLKALHVFDQVQVSTKVYSERIAAEKRRRAADKLPGS